MTNPPKLELTWIGKDARPRLEPRILLEDPTKNHHAKQRVSESDRGCLLELCLRPNGMNVYV